MKLLDHGTDPLQQLRELGPRVETGIFQDKMEVSLIDDGSDVLNFRLMETVKL